MGSCFCALYCMNQKSSRWKTFILPRRKPPGWLREQISSSDLVRDLDFNKAADGFELKLQEESSVLR